MDFKSLISQLDQLNEAEGKTVHKGTYGTSHGKEDVRDQYGHKIGKVNKDVETDKEAPKKGRGRPKKGADETGEVKKYDFSAFGVTKGKDVKLPKHDKKKTKKHSIKEYLEQMYAPLNEMGITVKPMPGASQIIGADGKPMGTADAATANTIKAASEKGTLKLGGDEEMKEGEMDEGVLDTVKSAVGLGKKPPATTAEKNAAFHAANKGRNMPSSGNASVDYDRFTGRDKVTEKDIGKHNNATTGFDALVRKLTPKYGKEAATKIAGAQLKKIKEGTVSDHPENQARIQKQFSSIPGLMDVWKKYKHLGDYGTNLQTTMSAVKKEFPRMDPKTLQSISTSLIDDNDPYSSNSIDAAFYAAKEIQKYLAGAQMQKIKEADQPPRDALASPLTLEAKKAKKPDANKNGIPDYAEDGKGKNDLKKKKVKENMDSESKTDKKKCPPMAHIKKMCKDGKSVAEICKMHPDCDQKELKQMVADCKKKMVKEGMDQKLNAARSEGKAHGLRGHSHCGKNYEDMEEARCYHEGYKEGLDECYGQVPIQGYVGETTPVVNTMASYGAEEGELAEADIEESPFSWAAKNTPKGSKFSLGGKEFVKNDAFAFEALEKQLNALLEDKEVTEGMTVSISKGQQGSPDSVSVSAQDAEADELLSVIKSAGLGLFGGDDSPGMSHTEPMTVDNGGEPAEIGAGGDAIEVVGDHDGMMSLMKKLSGIGGGEQSHDEHSHDEETCESCGGMMEAGHACSEGEEMIDEVESEDEMTYQMAEDNPPDSGADNTDAEDASVNAANAAAAAYNPSDDIDEGSEASDVGNIGVEAGDAEEEMKASMNEAETDDGELTKEPNMSDNQAQKDGLDLEESSFFNLYKKLAMLSEESTSEKDDKAEKAAKKVAKDIEYDEGHKGKDDDKAEEAGKKVKKDIEYDDKKDKKEKKLDEWANDAGPGKSVSDTTFETDMDFMMNVISGGLNKRKSTGQTTIPVVASQLGRQISRNTTSINESVDASDAVAQWKKLAGLK